jgi:DNA-binding beta-propeller fold protein YncE
MSNGTWTFSFATGAWEKHSPKGTIPNGVPGIVTAYDPVTGKVYLHDDGALYAYTFDTDTFEHLADDAIDYHLTMAIDPDRRRLVLVGAGSVFSYDIGAATVARKPLATTGGAALVSSGYPGLAYDSVNKHIVGWNGGDTVYALDLDTLAWTATTRSGGPGAAADTGTFKRWSYSSKNGIFVVVNGADENVYTFRF